MSAADDKKKQLDTGSNTGSLLWLLFIFMALGSANLYVGIDKTAQNQSRLTKAGNLRVLSQQVAKNASEASQGNRDAFDLLGDSTTQFQAQLQHLDKGDDSKGLTPSPDSVRGNQLKRVSDMWQDMSQAADVVSQGEDTVIGLYEISAQLSQSLPQMQFLFEKVQDILLDTGASPQQVMFATRQITYAERINRSFQEVLAGGDDAARAAENFGQDVDLFGEVLIGMLEGDAMLDIARVRNAQARNDLQQVQELYVTVKESVDYVISQTEQLFEVHKSSDRIFADAITMLDLTEKLQQSYELQGNDIKQIGHPFWSGIAGGLILILLFLLYRRQRRESSGRTESARIAADREKLQNERNQQAIIRLLDEMEGLADGDLTTNATVTEDFTGAIADAMNFTIDQLRSLVSTIKDSVVKLATATDATQNISMELAQASRNQAQEITGASAAINEMAVSIEQVSANASESATVAEKSVDIAKKGGE